MTEILQDAPVKSPAKLFPASEDERQKFRDSKKRSMTQAVNLQEVLYKLAMKPKTKASEVARLAATWSIVEDKRQVLAGVGRPKPVEARNAPGKRGRRAASASMEDPTETLPANGHLPSNLAGGTPNG